MKYLKYKCKKQLNWLAVVWIQFGIKIAWGSFVHLVTGNVPDNSNYEVHTADSWEMSIVLPSTLLLLRNVLKFRMHFLPLLKLTWSSRYHYGSQKTGRYKWASRCCRRHSRNTVCSTCRRRKWRSVCRPVHVLCAQSRCMCTCCTLQT